MVIQYTPTSRLYNSFSKSSCCGPEVLINSQLHNTNNNLCLASIVKASQTSSNIKELQNIYKTNRLAQSPPHEASQILKAAQEQLAKVSRLCSCHVLNRVMSVFAVELEHVKHVNHKARILVRHIANAVLGHLHM